jgi:hypothetical protein
MQNRGISTVIMLALAVIIIGLVFAATEFSNTRSNYGSTSVSTSSVSTSCAQDSDCIFVCGSCENAHYFNSQPIIPCAYHPSNYNGCVCRNNQCIPAIITTTTTSQPANPLQILSVQIVPADPKVGDTLDFNVTFKNVGNIPIAFMRGAGDSSLAVSYSPAGFFGQSEGACAQYVQVVNLQPDGIDNVGLDCAQSNTKLIKTGNFTAELTLSWGYEMNRLNNSISFSYPVGIS